MGGITRQNSPARAVLQPTAIRYVERERCIVLRSQCSVALFSSSLRSNGVKTHHILSNPALAMRLPWRLCWTLAGVLTRPKIWQATNWTMTWGDLNGDRGCGVNPKCLSDMERWLAFQDRLVDFLVSCTCFIASPLSLTGIFYCRR